jgi:hypothetical protein
MSSVSGHRIPHCLFGTGGPIGIRGSSSLNHWVPWFSDTGRAEVGGGVLPTGVTVAVASFVVLVDGAGGEFDGAGGEFDGAGGEFDAAAGAAGAGRLIVALPVSFKLAVAASTASAALFSEIWGFGAGILEFAADGGGPDFTDRMLRFFLFDTPNPKSKAQVRKHWLRPVRLRPLWTLEMCPCTSFVDLFRL